MGTLENSTKNNGSG